MQQLMFVLCKRLFTVTSFKAMSESASSLEDYFVPPESVRGSKTLDRDSFKRDFELPAIRLAHPSLCSTFLKRLSHACLKFRSIKSVLTETSEDGKGPSKVLLLAPHHLMKRPLSPEDREWIAANNGEEVTRVVTLNYQDYLKHTILRAILPADLQALPSGYESVGHIAHYNLREEFLPYKSIIGQVTLDKQQGLRTVVNKTDQIDNTFRFFKMEVLAGEPDFVASVKESGCTFTFDFSKVYWNSCLSTEHGRVLELLSQEDVVLDVFAGVGPFAVPAAKSKGCRVHANDLNPHSYQYLQENVRANRVTTQVLCYNLDGKEFIISTVRELARQTLGSEGCNMLVSHVIMNLPATAVQFLDAFHGLFSCIPEEHRSAFTLPWIHCYCFVKCDASKESAAMEQDALELVCSHLGARPGSFNVNLVRTVAPKKFMMRVSFKLPDQVAYSQEPASKEGGGAGCIDGVGEEPPAKRCKTDLVHPPAASH